MLSPLMLPCARASSPAALKLLATDAQVPRRAEARFAASRAKDFSAASALVDLTEYLDRTRNRALRHAGQALASTLLSVDADGSLIMARRARTGSAGSAAVPAH